MRVSSRAAIAAAYFAQGCAFLSLTTRLPKVESHWGLSQLGLTLLMLMIVLLAGAGSLLAERLAPRVGSATVLRGGLLTVCVALLASGPAPGIPLLVVGMAIYGLGLGVVDATSNMQAVALEHRVRRSLLPSFHGAWTAGGIVGTLVSLALPHASVAAVSVGVAVLPLMVAAAPYLPGRGGAVDPTSAGDIPWRPILLVGAACVVFYTVDTASTTWGSVYFDHTLGAPEALVALAALPYLVASLAARIAGDRLTDRFGATLLLRVGAVVAVVGLIVIVVAPSWPVGVLGFLVLGAGIAVVAPLSYSAAALLARGDRLDADAERARIDAVIARFNQFNYVGALVGSVLTGAIGTGSLRSGYAVPAVLVLALLPLARVFSRRTLASLA
ncbi:MFS transporter [Flexivirga sp. ID2601S]|uniref:MFS transporter n=1 Tax=Flexivirga aerilata TaxID=1656889 RepID=A0A849AF42_9MICO|nr:MFS transporter [Flexivirga aerilata]NNG39049.1 MFS transporter [Flexivirga aerilata]